MNRWSTFACLRLDLSYTNDRLGVEEHFWC